MDAEPMRAIEIETDQLWELADIIMETKKSHNLPSANWTTSDVILSESEGRRNREASGGTPNARLMV